MGICGHLQKNYHPVCNLPDYFKAPSWADWHEDIHTSHWESGLSPVSSLDKSRPLPSICDSLTLSFPKCTSPPERCHWGLWRTSGGLKMFLTDWPLHLFPEVTLVTTLSFMWEHWQNVHMTFPTVTAKSCIVWYACIIFETADFLAHICLSLHAMIRISFLRSLFHASYHELCLSELPIFWRWQLSTKRVLAIPCCWTAHLLLANV